MFIVDFLFICFSIIFHSEQEDVVDEINNVKETNTNRGLGAKRIAHYFESWGADKPFSVAQMPPPKNVGISVSIIFISIARVDLRDLQMSNIPI